MLKRVSRCLVMLGLLNVFASASAAEGDTVVLKTNMGEIIIELNVEKAPKTVANFKAYIEQGFYDGTVFHRVIPGFMVQGGGFSVDMKRKETNEPVSNEANNALLNETGTIAMARTGDPHSATSQFFINVNDNKPLNFSGENSRGWGYAVFGKVTKGMELVMQISQLATKRQGMHGNVPTEPVVIESITLR